MLRKLLVLTAILAVGSASVAAQETMTAPKDTAEKKVQSFGFIAPFGRSYLGIQTAEISKENFAKFGLAQARGVGVEKVLENSPAANAGLLSGDVIIRFENEEIKSVSKLTRLIGEIAPDQTAKITVLRGGSEREFNVTLGKRELSSMPPGNFTFENFQALPALPRTPQMPAVPPPPRLPLAGDRDVFIWSGAGNRQIGVGVTALTKQLSDYFGVSEGAGLLINNVRENSPAAKAGLKAGDIIVEIEAKEVKGQADLVRAVNEKKEGDISLTIIRDRNRQTVRVVPEASKDGAMQFQQFEKPFDQLENLFPSDLNRMEFQKLTPIVPLSTVPLKIAPRIL